MKTVMIHWRSRGEGFPGLAVSKQVQTLDALLNSLFHKYPLERHEHLYPANYHLNIIITFLQQGWLWYLITQEGWYNIKTNKLKPCVCVCVCVRARVFFVIKTIYF